MKIVGERLRELRKEKHITLEKMAKDFNTTSVSISRYESSMRQPKGQTINKLADYFQVSTDYLMGRTDDRTPLTDDGRNDVKKTIDKAIEGLESCDGLMFDGEPLEKEEFSNIVASLELILRMAKEKQEKKLKAKENS